MEFEKLWGLPAHPLVVHAAVVLLPLAIIATIVAAAAPKLRRYYAPVALGLAIAALLAIALAQGSGENLQGQVKETHLVEEHTEQGETVLPWAIGVVVVAGAVTAIPSLMRRRPSLSPSRVTTVVVVLSLIVGAGAMWRIVEVGHSGAKATWNDVEQNADRP